MLTIDTGFKAIPNASQEKVYTFVSDINNLQFLMPDRVKNWQSDADSCTFTIQGMADIGMRIKERQPHGKLILESFGKTPFAFTLDILFRESGSGSEASIVFNGEVNMFLKMVVEQPLTNFFGMLLEKLPAQFS